MEPKALAVPAVAQGLQGDGQRGPGSGCHLPPSTGHAAASGCARPGHPARGGSPSPAPWALRSPGVPLGQGRGAAPSRVPAACRGGSPSGAGDPLGTAPQQGSAGGTGLSPTPAQGTVALGPRHGRAGLGLSLPELLGAPVLPGGTREPILVPAALRHKGHPSACPRGWGAWPGCRAVARLQGWEQLGWGKAPLLLGFLPARGWVLPPAQWGAEPRRALHPRDSVSPPAARSCPPRAARAMVTVAAPINHSPTAGTRGAAAAGGRGQQHRLGRRAGFVHVPTQCGPAHRVCMRQTRFCCAPAKGETEARRNNVPTVTPGSAVTLRTWPAPKQDGPRLGGMWGLRPLLCSPRGSCRASPRTSPGWERWERGAGGCCGEAAPAGRPPPPSSKATHPAAAAAGLGASSPPSCRSQCQGHQEPRSVPSSPHIVPSAGSSCGVSWPSRRSGEPRGFWGWPVLPAARPA